jgi:hypothetical protein
MMSKKVIENVLNVYGNESDIVCVYGRVRSINKNFDLDNIVDVPTDLNDPGEIRAWKLKHWGTPENAFDVYICECDRYGARFAFYTEQHPPYIAIAELSAIFPDCDMELISSIKGDDKYSDIKISFYDGKIESVSRLEWVEDDDLQEKYKNMVDESRGE